MDGLGSLTLLDTALRGAAIALFLVIALATLRQGRRRPAVWLGAVLSAGAAAYAVCSAPGHPGHGSFWFVAVLALCAGNTVVFWLFTRAVFDDSFRPAPWHALLWFALVLTPVAGQFGAEFAVARPVMIARQAVPVALVLLALVQTVRDWRVDLVEGRRRLRLFIVAAAGLHAIVTVMVELVLGDGQVTPALHALNAGALAAIAAIISVMLLQADVESVLAGPVVTGPAVVAPQPHAAPPDEEPVDPALLATLERLMTVDRLYRQEGLTIGALAAKFGLPERRLRHAINRGLGFRNFNAYLNRHRLADAKQALADPTQAEVPILTIALDSGFQSLGPFNRAFKTDTGMTPTEFRKGAGSQKNG